jgi:TRAP transporter 4TM/12TM fusion protein
LGTSVSRLDGASGALQRFLGVSAPVLGILYLCDVPYRLTGYVVYLQQYLALFLSFQLAYALLSLPITNGPPQHKLLAFLNSTLVCFALLGGGYLSFFYPIILPSIGIVEPLSVLVGLGFIVALLESVRRLIGWPLVLVVLTFATYPLVGEWLPGVLRVKSVPSERLIHQIFLGPDFILGTPLATAAVVVLAFVFLSQLMLRAGMSEALLNLAARTMGRYRGAPAKLSVVGSALFGTLSGSAVGNVAAVGSITIPLMKRNGYQPATAAAVEAVASTGGCFLPPVMGAAAFVMAELIAVPYEHVAVAALCPALLFFLGVFVQLDLRASRDRHPKLCQTQHPILALGSVVLLSILVLLVVLLFGFRFRPELAALVCSFPLLVLCLASHRGKLLRHLLELTEGVTRNMLSVTLVCASAGIVVGVVGYTGLGVSLSDGLTALSGGSFAALALLTGVACIVLGMGMPVTASYLFLAVLACPALVAANIPPITAHLYVLILASFSFLTPPVCVAVYTAASLAGASPLKTTQEAVRLAIVGYLIPFVLLWRPELSLFGSPLGILAALLETALGVVVLSVSSVGYLMKPLSTWKRLVLLSVGLLLLVPGDWSRFGGWVGLLLCAFFWSKLNRD